jgi:hypothetical protein
MFTPYENHTTRLAAAMYAPCASVGCTEHAKPENAIEAKLDIFGSPLVHVCFCDGHYGFLAGDTAEHEIVPDIAIEEKK